MKTKQKGRPGSLTARIRRHIHLAMVPHKRNQYRPHIIRRYGLMAVLAVVVLLQMMPLIMPTGSVLGAQADLTPERLLARTNSERAQHGQPELHHNAQLAKAARLKADDMFRHHYWAHISPSGTEPWQWVSQAGYAYSYAGENLAKNFRSSDGVVTAWLASPQHRENMLGRQYQDIGIAVQSGELAGEQTTLVVALYGTPKQVGVMGTVTKNEIAAAGVLSPLARLGVAVQSLTPTAIGSLVVAILVVLVALLAHAYRKRLPLHLRQSLYRHHGLVKAGGMCAVIIVVVVLYSGGQI